jgi:hypothetical protein
MDEYNTSLGTDTGGAAVGGYFFRENHRKTIGKP